MRRALLPILAAVALAATAVAAPAAKAPAKKARAKAVAFVVQVVRPSADPVTLGSLHTRSGASTGGGDFAYPDDGAAARVTGSTTAVEASASGTEASAHTTVTGGAVSLLGGLVTASSLRVAAGADAKRGQAKSAVRARVSGLRVAGVSVNAGANDVIDLPGVGTLTVSETVEAIRSAGGRRTFTVALHLRLAKATAGLPAGSEILVGYAEGGAAAPKPPAGEAHRREDHRGRQHAGRRQHTAPARRDRQRRRARHVAHPAAAARRVHAHAADPARDEGRAAQRPVRVPGGGRRQVLRRLRRPPRPRPASTRASTCSRPTARRSSPSTTARCSGSAGTGSAAGACGSTTARATTSTTRTCRPTATWPSTARKCTRAT